MRGLRVQETARERAALDVLENRGANAGVAGAARLVGTEIRFQDDDPAPRHDAVESLRDRAPAPPKRSIHQNEVGITGARRQGG